MERKGQGKEKNEGVRNEEVVEKWEDVEGNKVRATLYIPGPYTAENKQILEELP